METEADGLINQIFNGQDRGVFCMHLSGTLPQKSSGWGVITRMRQLPDIRSASLALASSLECPWI
jgi:hypothetical protein